MTIELADNLQQLGNEIKVCPLCDLAKTRTNAVPGEGSQTAEVLFIGEAPGMTEDQEGRPFIGQAGKLLTQLIESAGLKRNEVFITNIVKCRPPNNRDPEAKEIAACAPYLHRQIALIKPKVVVTLGRFSMNMFFPGASISKIHGMARQIGSVHYLPMYHPAAALHQGNLLAVIKEDFLRLPMLIDTARVAGVSGHQISENGEESPTQLSLFS